MAKKKAAGRGGAREGAGRKPGADGPRAVVTASVSESLANDLDSFAEKKGWSRSQDVAEAIRKLLGRK